MQIDNIQYQDYLRLRTLLWEKQTFCINGTVIMKGFQPDIKPSQGYFFSTDFQIQPSTVADSLRRREFTTAGDPTEPS